MARCARWIVLGDSRRYARLICLVIWTRGGSYGVKEFGGRQLLKRTGCVGRKTCPRDSCIQKYVRRIGMIERSVMAGG